MRGTKARAIRRRNDPSVEVEEHHRGRSNLVAERDQPDRGLREIGARERTNEFRVAGEELRDDGVTLQLAREVAGIEREAHVGAVARRLGETLGQVLVGEPDDREGTRNEPGDPDPPEPEPPAGAGRDVFRLGHWPLISADAVRHKAAHPGAPPRAPPRFTTGRARPSARERGPARRCRHGRPPPPARDGASSPGHDGCRTGWQRCRPAIRWDCRHR